MPDNSGEKKGGPLVSISADDFFGLGKVADKVMHALEAGIGPALEPWVRARLAKADQRAVRGWAEVTKDIGMPLDHLEITTIAGRADIRLRAEKDRRQESREAVGLHAIKELPALLEQASDDPPPIESEWLDRFWRLAQDVTNEDIRSLWGRVLARRAVGASLISARTLEALSLLSRWEIADLERVAAFVCDSKLDNPFLIGALYDKNHAHGAPGMAPANAQIFTLLEQFDHQHFGSIGITSETGWGHEIRLRNDGLFWVAGQAFQISVLGHSVGPLMRFDDTIGSSTPFTQIGREILGLIRAEPNAEFLKALRKGLSVMGLALEPRDEPLRGGDSI